jgi:hypothetical protein
VSITGLTEPSIMRLKTILWSKLASPFYLRLLTQQRQAIDALVRELRESEAPGPDFRQIDDHPDYWFAKTPTDVLMVVQRRDDAYAVTGFADWQAQYHQALEAAAAALAEADAEPLEVQPRDLQLRHSQPRAA